MYIIENMKWLLYSILLIFIGIEAFAYGCMQKIYIKEVYDGDTVQGIVDGKTLSVRLVGIDCYETSAINRAYKQAYLNKITIEEVIHRGKCSKQILKKLLKNYPNTEVKITGKDKYERSLGILYANGMDVNSYMIEHGGCLNYTYKGK